MACTAPHPSHVHPSLFRTYSGAHLLGSPQAHMLLAVRQCPIPPLLGRSSTCWAVARKECGRLGNYTHCHDRIRLILCRYELLIDGEEKKAGSILEDFDPAVNPPEEIDDPKDSKPDDWIDAPKCARRPPCAAPAPCALPALPCLPVDGGSGGHPVPAEDTGAE